MFKFFKSILCSPANSTAHAELPNDYAAHKKQGNEFLAQGRLPEAAASYRQAIAINPDYADGFINLGFVSKELKLYEDAERYLQQAVQMDPALVDAYYLLGGIAQERGNLAEAVDNYKKALKLKPGFENVYGDLCFVLFQSGQIESAKIVIKQGLALFPHSAQFHFYLGNLYVDEKNSETAIACYKKALSIQPDHAAALSNMGKVYLEQGDLDLARDCYEKARSLSPAVENDHFLPDLPRHFGKELRKMRSVRDGYTRGWGIQFGDLRQKVLSDPLYQEGVSLALGRTILDEDRRINLYLLLKFFLPHLPFGHIVEFGAFRGGNAIFLAHVARSLLPGVKIYALDTFAGMPETDAAIDQHSAGDFAEVDLAELRAYCNTIGLDNIEFVQGLFEETSTALLERIGPVALAHIDCDIYSAVCYSYDAVKDHMIHGGYLVFDDATVSSCLGATEAVEDLLIRRDGLSSEQIFPHFVFRAFFSPNGVATS